MGLREFLSKLERKGIQVAEYQIRYAIKAGKITRPELDPSLRFQFSERQLFECVQLFGRKTSHARRDAASRLCKAPEDNEQRMAHRKQQQ